MSDRRREMRTDDSAASASSVTDSMRNLIMDSWVAGVYLISNSELETAKPEYILGRMLSTRSAISTDSSLAEMNQRARDDKAFQTFASVGAGQCGTIYALKGTTVVIKLPKSPEKSEDLFRDFKCHQIVYEAFRGASVAFRTHVHVPALRMWVNPKSEHFWNTNTALFHENVQVPDYGLVSERIYPLPYPVRSALVDTFAPKGVKDRKHAFLGMQKNKDCLIRLYMGRRNDDAPSTSMQDEKFHLRNFPLHVNEMERLKLETSYYAKLMAQALSIMHWRAGIDANDVEFVFGSSPQFTEMPTAQDISTVNKDTAAILFTSDFQHRTISVWLLDFNMCQTFTQDPAGLKKLVDAFYWNDPYYPRPGSANSKDKQLWTVFASHYLEVSAEFVAHSMPKAFIDAVEEKAKKRSSNSLFG